MTAPTSLGKLEALLRGREADWRRLAVLLDRCDAGDELDEDGLRELLELYRQSCADLNRLRALSADPVLHRRLNQLTGRAYRAVHGGRRRHFDWRALPRFYLSDVPEALRACRVQLLVACCCLLLGAALGFVAVMDDGSVARLLIPEQFFAESPRERVERIEGGDERVAELREAAAFGAFLFTHNIQVSLLAFGLGALTVIGGWWLLAYNGVILGAVAAAYVRDGVTTFFVAWVGPHGAIELPAIIVGAAAGLRFGGALLAPGEAGRRLAIQQALPQVWRLLACAASMLVIAGIIEGSFSQFSAKTVPYAVKIAVAALLFGFTLFYLSGALARGQRPPAAIGGEADPHGSGD